MPIMGIPARGKMCSGVLAHFGVLPARSPAPILPDMPKASQQKTRLQLMREARGWSRAKLAGMVGCAESYVTKLERRERKLKAEWIERFARALAIDPGNLLETVAPVASNVVMAPVIDWEHAATPTQAVAHGSVPVVHHSASVAAVQVMDRSMDRVAPPGTLIVFDYSEQQLEEGRRYLFLVNGKVLFRTFRSQDGPVRLEPESTDPGFRTIYPTGPLHVIGRVIYAAHPL